MQEGREGGGSGRAHPSNIEWKEGERIEDALILARSFQVNNILIVNLAVSDLLLCTVVSPMTLVEILFKRWTGPNAQVVCQLSGMVPVCVTFVSTLTITGIAIDR